MQPSKRHVYVRELQPDPSCNLVLALWRKGHKIQSSRFERENFIDCLHPNGLHFLVTKTLRREKNRLRVRQTTWIIKARPKTELKSKKCGAGLKPSSLPARMRRIAMPW